MNIHINNSNSTFEIYPTLPVSGEKTLWQTMQNGEVVDSLTLTFDNQNPSVNLFQEASLVLEIAKELQSEWSFFGNGIEYFQAIDNCNYNLRSYVSADKKTLVLKIANVGQTKPFTDAQGGPLPSSIDQVTEVKLAEDTTAKLAINFSYVVQYQGGAIFMSQDPGMIIRRPPNEM